MALEGKLQADFSSYYDAVDKAIVKQRDWDADAAKVERRLNTMTDGFSGRRVIHEAGLMSRAIQEAGGITALTDSELRRAGSTALEAAAKLKRLGQEVPPGLQAVADASLNLANSQDRVGPSSERMRSELRQVDALMSNLGFNMATEIKGLEQMVMVSGKTASQLGVLASSVAVAAAAFGGWTIGRKVSEFLELDKAIAGASNRLLFLATQGAQQDVIARAIEHGAEASIKYAEAVQFLIDEVKTAADAQIDWNTQLDDAKAQLAGLTQEQIDEIAVAQQLGATTEQLTAKFGLSADAQRMFSAETRTSTEILNSNAAHMAKLEQQLASSAQKRDASTVATKTHTVATKDDSSAMAEAATWQEAFRNEAVFTTEVIAEQVDVLEEVADAAAEARRQNDEFMNAATLNNRAASSFSSDVPALTGIALDDVISRFHQAGDTSDTQALERALATLEGQEGRVKPTDNASFFQLQRDTLLLAQLRQMLGADSFAGGVENFTGGLAYVHKDEMLVNMPKGTSVIPAGRGGGAPTFNITVAAGLGDRHTIVRAIKEMLVEEFTSFGNRGPVPFGA